MVSDMLALLREVRDPRDFTARHDLGEMLFLALCGLLCGEKACVDIADFASAHEAEFREVPSLRHGTPSHDTLSRTLRLLDPRALERALRACLSAMGHRLRAGGVLSVDGKALRRASEAGQSHMPPVMVSVFDGLTRLSLAQSRAGAGGEAEAARVLLGSLVVKGCTVTALLPGLAAFGRIVGVRQVAGGREEVHTRSFALSRLAGSPCWRARIGGSRTTSTGRWTWSSTRTTPAPARTAPRRTSPCCASYAGF